MMRTADTEGTKRVAIPITSHRTARTKSAGVLLFGIISTLVAQTPAQAPPPPPEQLRVAGAENPDLAFPGDFSGAGVIGNSLPESWRPFRTDSPWNTPIPSSAALHPDSVAIVTGMTAQASHIRFGRSYTIPLWVVNGQNVTEVRVRSDAIFDFWDTNRDGWTDILVPVTPEMWAEATPDGHISVIDPFRRLAYEMSRFSRLPDGTPTCTTFNVWALDDRGYGDPNEGQRWQLRGGRGSGFPLIAGLLRPEEITAGEVRHALVFSYPQNRRADDGSNIFLSPACRSDGAFPGATYPIEGMRFQLDPALNEQDFDGWGLTAEARIVARALQRYGMFLGDNGGAMAIYPQLLAADGDANVAEWERRFPGLFGAVARIPTDRFRIVDTGTPIVK